MTPFVSSSSISSPQELIQMQYNALVALYVSRLPSALQVNCYAQLLEGEWNLYSWEGSVSHPTLSLSLSLSGIEDPVEQKQCLDLGKEAGLDVAVVTKTVVEHIRNTGVVRCHKLVYGKDRQELCPIQDDLNITTAEVGQLSEVPEITKVLLLSSHEDVVSLS